MEITERKGVKIKKEFYHKSIKNRTYKYTTVPPFQLLNREVTSQNDFTPLRIKHKDRKNNFQNKKKLSIFGFYRNIA